MEVGIGTYLIARDAPLEYGGRAKNDSIVQIVGETPTQWLTDAGLRFTKQNKFPGKPTHSKVIYSVMEESLKEHGARVCEEAEYDLTLERFKRLRLTVKNWREVKVLLDKLGV